MTTDFTGEIIIFQNRLILFARSYECMKAGGLLLWTTPYIHSLVAALSACTGLEGKKHPVSYRLESRRAFV